MLNSDYTNLPKIMEEIKSEYQNKGSIKHIVSGFEDSNGKAKITINKNEISGKEIKFLIDNIKDTFAENQEAIKNVYQTINEIRPANHNENSQWNIVCEYIQNRKKVDQIIDLAKKHLGTIDQWMDKIPQDQIECYYQQHQRRIRRKIKYNR